MSEISTSRTKIKTSFKKEAIKCAKLHAPGCKWAALLISPVVIVGALVVTGVVKPHERSEVTWPTSGAQFLGYIR